MSTNQHFIQYMRYTYKSVLSVYLQKKVLRIHLQKCTINYNFKVFKILI